MLNWCQQFQSSSVIYVNTNGTCWWAFVRSTIYLSNDFFMHYVSSQVIVKSIDLHTDVVERNCVWECHQSVHWGINEWETENYL